MQLNVDFSRFKFEAYSAIDTSLHGMRPDDYCAFGITPPVPVHQPEAEYPPQADSLRLEGFVWVKAHIDTIGHVDFASILKSEMGISVPRGPYEPPVESFITPSDSAVLHNAALHAIVQWKFKPAEWNGRVTESWSAHAFRFRLPKRG